MPIETRLFTRQDVPQLLDLMRGLAEFEDYLDDFRVSEEDLIERGLGPEPQFYAHVGVQPGEDKLLGMAVTYVIPYTYDLRPTLVLKELFIREDARGLGVGHCLFGAVKAQAEALGCGKVAWTVMRGNRPAEEFYERQGAREDSKWINWSLKL